MSQLAQLRQKIKSVQTTKKITHAVRLISMSFYNKLDKLDQPLKTYTKGVSDLFLELLRHSPSWKKPLLFPTDVFDSTPLYIIISTSKGLCGSLNSNLFRYLDSALFIEKHQQPQFITIGQKATNYIKEKGYNNLICSYTELTSHNFIALADDLVDKMISSNTLFSSVSLFANEARSFFVQKPSKYTLIPLSLEPTEKEENDAEDNTQISDDSDTILWEQPQEEVLDFLAIKYLRSSLIQLIFQALRAEHAARFMAMENSTNNAEKYLERLTLQFNKLRQSLITKEVSELSSGIPQR